jgi:hypothetical protein
MPSPNRPSLRSLLLTILWMVLMVAGGLLAGFLPGTPDQHTLFCVVWGALITALYITYA